MRPNQARAFHLRDDTGRTGRWSGIYRSRFCFGLALLLICLVQACSVKQKDRFALVDRDIDPDQLQSVGGDYAWGFGVLGDTINGHGLPDKQVTFMLVHKPAGGKPELVWPDFLYGDDQANAAVLGDTVVFTARLPDGRSALMAHHPGEPPMVITPAVLRLAVRRLGPSIIVPGTDYSFSQVRLPPGRIWLQGMAFSPAPGPDAKPFAVELTAVDLGSVMDETRQRGQANQANNFKYVAEAGAFSHIEAADAKDLPPIPSAAQATTLLSTPKGRPYVPQDERLQGNVLLDPAGRMAFFSTINEPAKILKVALGDNAADLPLVLGAVVLEPEENNAFNGIMDTQGGVAYFCTDFPGHIVKVGLGAGNEPPHRVGSVLLDAHENVGVGAVDSTTGYGCFSVRNRLYKIKLGRADEPPSIVSSVELPGDGDTLVSAVLDPATHTAYFGGDWVKIYKVVLGEDDSPLRFAGEMKLPEEEGGLRGALIDPRGEFAWFVSSYGSVVKVSLGGKDSPPARIGALKLGPRFRYLEHTFGMDDAGYAYLGTMESGDSDGAVLKIALGKGDELPRLASFLKLEPGADSITGGVVDPATRTLCLGIGSVNCSIVKMALGEGDNPPKIIGTVKLSPK
jgi:hypothetical protein